MSPRLTIHDVHFSRLTGVGIVGPVDLPAPDAVREVLLRLGERFPEHRLFCRPEIGRLGRGRWVPLTRREREARCHGMVSELPSPVDVDALTHAAAQPDVGDQLMHLAMGDGYVFIAAGHVLGDASTTELTPPILLAAAGLQPLPHLDDREVRFPLTRAFVHHFGRRPRRVVDAVRERRRHFDAAGDDPAPPGWSFAPPTELTAIARTTSVETATALSRWRKQNAASLSMGSVLTAAVRRAFDDAGVKFSTPGIRVLVNARRFLPPGTPVPGNFTTAIYVEPVDPCSPADIEAVVRRNLESGRPLATMAVTTVKEVLGGRWTQYGPTAAGSSTLTVSNPGRSTSFETLPLREGADHRVASPPEGPGGVTVQLTQLNGRCTATATFHPTVIDRAAIVEALDALAGDPVALLG